MGNLLRLFLKFFIILVISKSAFAERIDTLNIPLHATKISLDPATVQDVSSLWVSRQINCQLLQLQGAAVSLGVASEVKYINSKKILITINKSARFNDGSAITAEDVIASYHYLKNSRLVFRNVFSWVKSIEAPKENQILIELNQPFPQFLDILATPHYSIYKKEFLEKAKNQPLLWKYPVSCGNYIVKENTPSMITLKPKKEGYLIIFHLIKDNQISLSQLKAYDISDLAVIEKQNKLSGYNILKLFDPYQIYLGLNLKKEIWKNRVNRCSFLSKLNNMPVKKLYENSASIANDILPPEIIGYQDSENHLEKIKQKYSKVPLPEIKNFCVAFLSVSVPDYYRTVYLSMFKKLYPNAIQKIITNTGHFGSEFINTHCDAIILGFKSSTFDGYGIMDAFSRTDSSYNGFLNKEIIKLLKESQETTDPLIRFKQYREIVKEIENQCVIFPMVVIPYREIYIKNNLVTPGIGKVPLDEYYLGDVKRKIET